VAFALYCDQNVMHRVVLNRLRAGGVDCLTSEEAGNRILTDEEQLAFAAEHDRTIVTFDKGDFSALHATWMAGLRTHAGMIILTTGRLPVAVRFAKHMRRQAERTPGDMRQAILFLGPSPIEESQ
jgi:predicted nuclease of predicted toxin-antitoxin system